jgi:TRAP-type C4-dicarboxylate transport system substrate-binding protein
MEITPGEDNIREATAFATLAVLVSSAPAYAQQERTFSRRSESKTANRKGNVVTTIIKEIVPLAAFIMLPGAFPAVAQETITLRYAHPWPSSHLLWEHGGKPFTERVTAATNGQVKFEVYPAGQLGKDFLALLETGLADVVNFPAAYSAERLPLSSVAEIPGNYSTSCEATNRVWEVTKPGGVLNEREYKKYNLRLLFVNQPPAYKIMTSSKPIEKAGDIAGLKLRGVGANQVDSIRALGGVPIQVTASEMYDALSRGTIDGAAYFYGGMPSFNMDRVLRYAVDGIELGSVGTMFAMNEKAWNALPQPVRKAIEEAATATRRELCAYIDQDDKVIRARYLTNGFKVTNLSQQDAADLKKRLRVVEENWIKSMEQAGQEGRTVLEAFKAAPGTNAQ